MREREVGRMLERCRKDEEEKVRKKRRKEREKRRKEREKQKKRKRRFHNRNKIHSVNSSITTRS